MEKFVKLITESKIPANVIRGFKRIADEDGDVSVYDLYNVQQALVQGRREYHELMGYFFNDPVGTKFYEIFSTGFNIKDMEDFDSEDTEKYTKIDKDIKGHSDLLVYKFDDFTSSEILYQMFKYLLANDFEFDFSKIKKFSKSNTSLNKLFTTEIGKAVLQQIYNKNIKQLDELIAFLKGYAEKDNSLFKKVGIDNLGVKFKKFNSDVQTYFKDSDHYVCSVFLEDDSDLEEAVLENDFSISNGPRSINASQLYDIYKNRVTSHSATLNVGKFNLGWVRFSIKDNNGEKLCIIDELQSDLKPNNDMSDQHKVYIHSDVFKSFFGDVNTMYKLILQKFIYEIREQYKHSKIYAPSYDIKKEVGKLTKEPNRERFQFLSDEDFEGLKDITPPMFPYKEIIPSFGFRKSDIPGFLVLERRMDKKMVGLMD